MLSSLLHWLFLDHPTPSFRHLVKILVFSLGRKLELFALQNLGDVQIEEVAVENGLHAAGDDRNDVIESLRIVPVDPVENVEAPIAAQREQVVAGDGLRLAGLAHHEELGQNGHTLQVDGEGPEDFHRAELMVQDQGQQGAGTQQELNPESIMVAVVGGLELDIHQVDGGGRGADKEDLHDGVVDGDEVGDEVQVAGHEHNEEEDLRLARDAGTGPGLPYLEEQEDDGEQVGEITSQPEDVHDGCTSLKYRPTTADLL